MNGHSLTTLFVAPSGTLASANSTQDLTDGQLGLFRPDYSIATSGNIAAANYFYIAQGRPGDVPGLGSKRSDKIKSTYVKKFYKTLAEDTATVQIAEFSDLHVKCGEDVVFTFRVHSGIIDIGFYNGYTKSVIVKAPCCDCGDVPCEDIEASDTEALVDAAIAALSAAPSDPFNGGDINLSTFLVFEKSGTGDSTKLVVATKPSTIPTALASDITGNQYQYDRVWFRGFVHIGAENSADFEWVPDRCEQVGTFTITQRSSYPSGSAEEIRLLEKRYYSYQTSHFKHLHKNPDWNGAFKSYVVDGKFYDLYYIVFSHYDEDAAWSDKVPLDSTVIVAFEAGEGSAFETAVEAALGASTDESGLDISTTTTTSTTSTTTTSTTTLIP